MSHLKFSYRWLKHIYPMILIVTIYGCGSMTTTEDPVFDISLVDTMLIRIVQPGEPFAITLTETDTSPRVAANLTQWNYLITDEDNSQYTHELTVFLEPIQLGSTPVGFSWSAGNSNPRALDFQKAEVMPITCALNARENPDLVAELTMDVAARDILKYSKPVVERDELVETLVNDISTVCYNLLSGLDVPTSPTNPDNPTKTTKSPTWWPDVTIENEPMDESSYEEQSFEQSPARTEVQPAEKSGINVENEPPQESPTHVQTEPAVTESQISVESEPAAESQKSESSSIHSNRIKPSPRKRIIIRNHGTPVIFTFGHERK